jgi:periplasmic protein CpxP/Spy
MKVSFSSIAIAAGLCVASMGFVSAADTQKATVSDSVHAPHHWGKDPTARAQKHLDKLGKKLNLTAAQQPAWTIYSSAMLKLAQEHAQERDKWKSAGHSETKDITTPERLEKMAARLRTGAEKLSKLAADTKTFYEQLSPEQKTIFDLYAAHEMRHTHHMHR